MSKFYITTPIYYVNDIPHIGHAYTTVAADVLARYHRLRGDDVFFLTGTDEHGAKVAETAQNENKTPQELCDENSAKFQMLWDELDISNDDYIRTTEKRHQAGVEKFLNKLKENNAVYEGQYHGLYCTGCERFLTEKELVDGKCPDHQTEPNMVNEKNYFFKLKDYLNELKKAIDKGDIKILPENKKNEVLGLFKQELDDFSISRESVKWGIEVPFAKGQVVYVWVDALINYLSAIGYENNQDNFNKYWPADVHLMAKDILKFHAVYWPAMLMAAGMTLPKTIYAHGFFTVDGQKMSKSLGNVIDPYLLNKEFGSDAIRFMLLSQFPFGNDGDVRVSDFAIQYNTDLANGVGNLTSRILSMANKYFNDMVPDHTSFVKDDTASAKEFSDEVIHIWKEYEKAMTCFQLDQVINNIRKWISFCDGYVERQKPWELAKTDKEKLAYVIYNLLESLRHLALLIYPIMPQTADKIFASLGCGDFTNVKYEELKKWGLMQKGDKIKKIDSLFPRLESYIRN